MKTGNVKYFSIVALGLGLTLIASARADSCESLANRANQSMLELNGGGSPLSKSPMSKKIMDGGVMETYSFHNAVSNGLANVAVKIWHAPQDETNPECTVTSISLK